MQCSPCPSNVAQNRSSWKHVTTLQSFQLCTDLGCRGNYENLLTALILCGHRGQICHTIEFWGPRNVWEPVQFRNSDHLKRDIVVSFTFTWLNYVFKESAQPICIQQWPHFVRGNKRMQGWNKKNNRAAASKPQGVKGSLLFSITKVDGILQASVHGTS